MTGLLRVRLAGSLLAVLALAGCQNAFDPTVDPTLPFAIDGRLDGSAAVQRLRVQDVGAAPGAAGPLDGVVTSTDLATGERLVWADSLVTLADGTPAHLFQARFAVRVGGAYRIEAVRPDGGAASVVEVRIDAPTVGVVPPDPASVVQLTEILGLSRPPEGVAIRYRVRRVATGATATLDIPYPFGSQSGRFRVFANLETDAARIREALGLAANAPAGQAELLGASIVGTARAAARVPVRNGYGAVDWVVPLALPFPVEPGLLSRVGLADGQ